MSRLEKAPDLVVRPGAVSCSIAVSYRYQATRAYETHDDAQGRVPGGSGVLRSVEFAAVKRGLAVYAVDVERTLFVVQRS